MRPRLHCSRLGLERKNAINCDGLTLLLAVSMTSTGTYNFDDNFTVFLDIFNNFNGQVFTVLQRKNAHRTYFGFVQPLRNFGTWHLPISIAVSTAMNRCQCLFQHSHAM
ncbi:hypothetical protein AciX9_0046 [Granulicella tundricola MP5ACTX9]|uniref:Uncharacterized protein n=1 Tax=Granulicella tundricola (strain ATCC BAA-1859 / DSM 23138 / MP5ACTX9) TaxID=1198114 RepID=E8X477_GRATM|nr:hypothetical protein AciX9_0046 [Granulicella tundricola MP5ACTX9]